MATLFELQSPSFGTLTKTKALKTENAAHTLTTAEIIEGIVQGTPTGARNITTPTAAEIITALGTQGDAVGMTFELTIVNKASSTHAFTLVGGTSVTVNGVAAVSALSSGTFIFRVESTTTVHAYRK